MKVVLSIIFTIAALIATAMLWEFHHPIPVTPADPYLKAEYEKKKEDDRQRRIIQRAYEECKEQKLTPSSIIACVQRKVT